MECPNQELLSELCYGNDVAVANTFLRTPVEEKITYFSPGASPMGPVCEGHYHMLDLVICDSLALECLRNIPSWRSACLATNHYLVIFVLAVPMDQSKKGVVVRSPLKDTPTLETFQDAFWSSVEEATCSGVQERWKSTVTAMRVAETCLFVRKRTPQQTVDIRGNHASYRYAPRSPC